MGILAASGDTWGISGPAFLTGYLVLSILSLITVGTLRRRAYAGTSIRPTSMAPLSPSEMAYLAGGWSRAVAASLAALRSMDAIHIKGREVTVTGEPTAEATPLDRAVHRAIKSGWDVRQLGRAPTVLTELDRIKGRLGDRGLAVTGRHRLRCALGLFALVPVLTLGVVRMIAGTLNEKPTGFLFLAIIGTLIVGLVWCFAATPSATRAGRRLVRSLRQRHRTLSPDHSPATSTYGPAAAATAVALFGASALWLVDPKFNQVANVLMGSGGSTGYSYTSYTSGCGSSAGGCGGGGDGGGGCGGGGCGG